MALRRGTVSYAHMRAVDLEEKWAANKSCKICCPNPIRLFKKKKKKICETWKFERHFKRTHVVVRRLKIKSEVSHFEKILLENKRRPDISVDLNLTKEVTSNKKYSDLKVYRDVTTNEYIFRFNDEIILWVNSKTAKKLRLEQGEDLLILSNPDNINMGIHEAHSWYVHFKDQSGEHSQRDFEDFIFAIERRGEDTESSQTSSENEDTTFKEANNKKKSDTENIATEKGGSEEDAKSITGKKFVGIINSGNLCYQSSVLQCLFAINALRRAVYYTPIRHPVDSSEKVMIHLQQVFYCLETSKLPINVKRLRIINSDDEFSAQQDAHEFMVMLLKNLEQAMTESPFEDTISKVFKGKMISLIKCRNIQFEKVCAEEEFCSISLHIGGKANLYDSLDKLVQPEFLVEDNKYDTGTEGLQEAEKTTLIKSLPPVLIFHLLRFHYNAANAQWEKMNTKFEFMDQIELSKYMKNPLKAQYKLHTVIVHSGSIDNGHYISFIDSSGDGDWWKFDDHIATRTTKTEAIDENFGDQKRTAYILVYIRQSELKNVLRDVPLNNISSEIEEWLEPEKEKEVGHEKENPEGENEKHKEVDFEINQTEDFRKFKTIFKILNDERMRDLVAKLLKCSGYFNRYLTESEDFVSSYQALSYLLKSLAIVLKSTWQDGNSKVEQDLVTKSFGRLEEILNTIQLENNPVKLPDLEFFDGLLVMQALGQCEYIDSELKTRLVRVEMLDRMLKEEILKLEKSTVLRLPKKVHSEVKEILQFASTLNQCRIREGCKLLVFEGWRQVVEILALSPTLHNADFCSNVLRMLLSKVVGGGGSQNKTEYFLRLAAETVLTLSAVMERNAKDAAAGEVGVTGGGSGDSERGEIIVAPSQKKYQKNRVSGAGLSVVIHHHCVWLQSSQNPNVRGILYASLLHCVNLMTALGGEGAEVLMSVQQAFPLILHNLCEDCCQGVGEKTRMQALLLMGEIIYVTTQRGLAGSGSVGGFTNKSSSSAMMMNVHGSVTKDSSVGMAGQGPEWKTDDSQNGDGPDLIPNDCTRAYGENDSTTDVNLSSTSLNWVMKPNPNISMDGSEDGRSPREDVWGFGMERYSDGSDKSISGRSSIPGVHETIMDFLYSNGFLRTLVEALCVVDDNDLISSLTSGSQDDPNHIMALTVFEAKLTMLTRLAGVGPKSVMYLLDLNLIKRLTDMKVFELQSYNFNQPEDGPVPTIRAGAQGQSIMNARRDMVGGEQIDNQCQDESFRRGIAEHSGLVIEPLATSTPRSDYTMPLSLSTRTSVPPPPQVTSKSSEMDEIFSPSHSTISESLFVKVFEVFHSMYDSAPHNVQVIEQVLQFLQVHDSALSKLLSPYRICLRDTPRTAATLLISLLRKLAQNQQRTLSLIPIFTPNGMLKPGILNILRIQAERNIAKNDQVASYLVRLVLHFLQDCCHVNAEIIDRDGEKKEVSDAYISYPVLTNSFDMDTVLRYQDENLSLGVIIQCVINAAQNIISSQMKEKKANPMITASSLQQQQSGADSSSMSMIAAGAPASSTEQTFLTPRMIVDNMSSIEIGLSLIFFHVQYFLCDLKQEKQLRKGDRVKDYQDMLAKHIESHLVKTVIEACKKLDEEEYIEMLLLKLRMVATTSSLPTSSPSDQ